MTPVALGSEKVKSKSWFSQKKTMQDRGHGLLSITRQQADQNGGMTFSLININASFYHFWSRSQNYHTSATTFCFRCRFQGVSFSCVLVLHFFKEKKMENGSIFLAPLMRHILASLNSVAYAADGIQKEA